MWSPPDEGALRRRRPIVVAADKGTDVLRCRQRDRARVDSGWAARRARRTRLRPQSHGHHRAGRVGIGQAPLRHLDIDPDRNDFTVVGIGDMSGDVFGNGMLLSKHIKLVAAPTTVFLDPSGSSAFAERKRLFEIPRSSWADYDVAHLGGGGVHPRR